jgi:integrase
VNQLTAQKYLTEAEQAHLRRVLARCSERDECYFLVLLETGARLSEALNIEPMDLIDERCAVFLRGIKGSNSREVGLRPDLYSRVKRLCVNGKGPFPFSTSNADRIWRIVRPVRKKLHSLRHSFAINLLARTGDLHIVNYALGHKNIQNTMIYLQVSRAEDLRRALNLI